MGNKNRKGPPRGGSPKDSAPNLVSAKDLPLQDPGEIHVFLSYARIDNDSLGFIRPFKETLAQFVLMKLNREISLFLDQDDLRWGEVWKERLEEEILRASVLISFMSASYLRSENCRAEFTRFLSTAENLGARSLILPILVLDAPKVFHEDSDDDLVKYTLDHQYERLHEAALAGSGSPEWRRVMNGIADSFVSAYLRSEEALANAVPTGASGAEENSTLAEDRPGLLDLLPIFQQQVSDLQLAADDWRAAMEALPASADIGAPGAANSKDAQLWAIGLANRFKGPAVAISDASERLFLKVMELNQTILDLKRIGKEVPGVSENIAEMLKPLQEIEGVSQQMEELLKAMRTAENVSAAVRKSLAPMRSGITRTRDALRLVQHWTD